MNYRARHYDILPPSKTNATITIVGGGAVGSIAALTLAKLGYENITVLDFDEVSEENISCQFYRISDIGRPKVEALQEIVEHFSGTKIAVKNTKWEGQPFESDIVVAAVDSMLVRSFVWDSVKQSKTKLFIDPRMGAENALLYVSNPHSTEDVERYEKTLYSDDDSVQEKCTAKATTYTAFLLGSMVTKVIKDFSVEGKQFHSTIWNIAENDFESFHKKEKENGTTN